MMTLYGLTEQEWVNLAVAAGWDELTKPLLELKSLYHNTGSFNRMDRSDAEIDATKIYMIAKLQVEILRLGKI